MTYILYVDRRIFIFVVTSTVYDYLKLLLYDMPTTTRAQVLGHNSEISKLVLRQGSSPSPILLYPGKLRVAFYGGFMLPCLGNNGSSHSMRGLRPPVTPTDHDSRDILRCLKS